MKNTKMNNKIGVGAARWREAPSSFIDSAIDLGVTHFDTAPNYFDGTAIQKIASALSQTKSDQNYILSTKVGFTKNDPPELHKATKNYHDISPTYVRDSILNTLNRCPENLPVRVFLHNPELALQDMTSVTALRTITDAFLTLEELYCDGIIRDYGLASWSFEYGKISLNEIIDSISSRSHRQAIGFRAIQLPLSFVHCEPLYLYMSNKEGPLGEAETLGIDVYASAPLAGGVLPSSLDDSIRLAIAPGMSNLELCIGILEMQRPISTILFGTTGVERLKSILKLKFHENIDREVLLKTMEEIISERKIDGN